MHEYFNVSTAFFSTVLQPSVWSIYSNIDLLGVLKVLSNRDFTHFHLLDLFYQAIINLWTHQYSFFVDIFVVHLQWNEHLWRPYSKPNSFYEPSHRHLIMQMIPLFYPFSKLLCLKYVQPKLSISLQQYLCNCNCLFFILRSLFHFAWLDIRRPPLPPTSNMISMTFTSLISNKLFRFSGSYDWIIKNSFSQAEYIHKCANCVRSEKELFLHLCFILWVSPTIHLSLMVIPYEIFSPCPSPKIIKTFEEKIIYDLKSSFLVVKFLFMATVLFILDKCRGQEILSELNALKFMISFNR